MTTDYLYLIFFRLSLVFPELLDDRMQTDYKLSARNRSVCDHIRSDTIIQ